MKVIMLGAPGAGKGTQAKEIAKKYQIPHISTGDIFRQNIKDETELGKEVKSFLEAGRLVPDSLTVSLVLDRIQKDDCKNGYILDGFPRTIPQAASLDSELWKEGTKIDAVINVEVPDDVIVLRNSTRRLCRNCGAGFNIMFSPPKKEGICDLCGGELYQREDDTEGIILNRLDVYYKSTAPLVDYYRNQGNLLSVNGNQEKSVVLKEIFALLEA